MHYTHLYTLALAMANAGNFDICIDINFGCQQNTSYMQTCAVESKTMRNCYQKCTCQVNEEHLRTKLIW